MSRPRPGSGRCSGATRSPTSFATTRSSCLIISSWPLTSLPMSSGGLAWASSSMIVVLGEESSKERVHRRAVGQDVGPVLQVVDRGARVDAEAVVEGGDQVAGGDGVGC